MELVVALILVVIGVVIAGRFLSCGDLLVNSKLLTAVWQSCKYLETFFNCQHISGEHSGNESGKYRRINGNIILRMLSQLPRYY